MGAQSMFYVQKGWGTSIGIPPWVLAEIGWAEYIETASMPYPFHLVPTERNAEALRKRMGPDKMPTDDYFDQKWDLIEKCRLERRLNAQ